MTKIFVVRINEKFHVMLQHEDGNEEISDNAFDTKEECEKAIDQYIKDRGIEVSRVQ